MANTKIPIELSSTPSIVDNGNATALTINSSENAKFEGLVGINKDINASVALSVGADATSATSYGLEVTNSTANTRFLVNGEGSSIFYKTDNSEGMRFNASTGGLTFNGDTAAANALDDYEEGTFTPTISAGGVTYSYQVGWYTKIGNLVNVGVHLDVNVNSNASGTAVAITLPFTSSYSNAQAYSTTATVWCNGWASTPKADIGLLGHNASIVTFYYNNGTSLGASTQGQLGGGNILFNIQYTAA